MESGLRVGEGGSGGCDEVKTKPEGIRSAILPPTLLPRRGPHRTLCPGEQRVRKERNSVLTGRLEGLVLLLPLGVLDSVFSRILLWILYYVSNIQGRLAVRTEQAIIPTLSQSTKQVLIQLVQSLSRLFDGFRSPL